MTWLTPAGFDWELWNASSTFGRVPPSRSATEHLAVGSESEEWRSDLKQTVAWMLALGDIPSGG